LLFTDLPKACGFELLKAVARADGDKVDALARQLRDALRELQSSYGELLRSVKHSLFSTFGLAGDTAVARQELSARAKELFPVAADTRLKGFLVRLADEALDFDDWVVSLATLLGGKPPESWRDEDVQQMHLNLELVARRFSSLEALVFERSAAAAPEGTTFLRVSIAEPGKQEAERVVAVRPSDSVMMQSFCDRVRDSIASTAGDLPREAMLAALALLSRELIDQTSMDEPVDEHTPRFAND
jgi:hypothetical protein